MAREFTRSDRVADAVQRLLAQMIPAEIRDPRVGMVNVNSVDVARDLSIAKVYVTVVGAEKEGCEQAVVILNKAAGFLRSLISKELTMRSTPKLMFYYDFTAHQGGVLSGLIDKAVAADKAKRADDTDDSEQ
ncbi:30S ribosome-binding factor RbfA [Marinagarivorans cellulosilyticus]|uniref:Ribosome-binding factor A n=1 Tax=Marinagarivorans cellulosilyticus TaxID=2721545 RepID=A0AAN1WGZ7_9GAMM|nr:30S ribosome-binding factor RbfA [Marinagarivorans cellulosilyticus]BCD97423.1 ribosome-binding factor A [Marinagarivorans cellulosilyticus]